MKKRVLLRSLNPEQYRTLCAELSVRDALRNAWRLFLVALLLGAVTTTTLLVLHARSLDLAPLNVTLSATHADARVALGDGLVVDLTPNATRTDERLHVSGRGVTVGWWTLARTVPWREVKTLDADPATLTALAVLAAPSVLFYGALLLLVKDALVILAVTLILYLVPRLWRHKTGLRSTMTVALLATPYLFVELPLLFLVPGWIFTALYAAMALLGVLLVGERDLR